MGRKAQGLELSSLGYGRKEEMIQVLNKTGTQNGIEEKAMWWNVD